MMMLCSVFQFMSVVLLAMVGAMRSILLFSFVILVVDMSPSRQSDGDGWMWLTKAWDRKVMISCQN